MAKSESSPALDSTFSEPMDDSKLSDAMLALGRKLIEELGLEPSVDTLGRWMVHYISELIVKAESARDEEKSILEKDCFDAILALWRHRTKFPDGKRPFEGLESIVRSIASLDPDSDMPRYVVSINPSKVNGEESTDVDRWFKVADRLDYSARILIGYCLANAASAAMDKSKEWVKLAEAAGVESEIETLVINFVSTTNGQGEQSDPNGNIRRKLNDRLNRLEEFNKIAIAVADDLKEKINALSEERGDGAVG